MDKNVVLIGFSGTGKTSVGKLIAEKLQFNYIDIDTEIKQRCSLNIGDIFEKHGEKFFREIEAEIVREFSKAKDYVIATGGGVVLNSANIDSLKENGIVFRLKGSVETIIENLKKDSLHMKDRPLLKAEHLYQRISQLMQDHEQLYCQYYDYEVSIDRKSLMEVAETIADLLNQDKPTSPISFFDLCGQYPDKQLFTYIGKNTPPVSLTGRELAHKIKILGSAFQDKLASQEKVLLIFEQGLEYIYSLFSCWYANVIAIPIAITASAAPEKIAEKVNAILSDSHAKGIITNTGFMESFKAEPSFGKIPVWNIGELIEENSSSKPARSFAPDDLGLLLYTSGSTSKPKGVMISHQNLMARALRGGELWNICHDSRIVSWMPQFHSFGLDFSILTPLSKGATCIILAPSHFLETPEDWWRIIDKYQATHTGAPNFAFDYCYSTIDIAAVSDLSLRSLEAIISGGEPFRKETYQNFMGKFRSLGLNDQVFCPEYGLSEAGSLVTKKPGQPLHFLTLDIPSLELGIVKHAKRKIKSKTITNCGEIGEGVEIRIVNPETGEPCPVAVIGEIWVRCASTAKGYFSLEPETNQSFWGTLKDSSEEGFLRTGDLGFIEENSLYIVGRQKEVIIIHGKNHHPVDLEWTIRKYLPELTLPVAVFAREIDNQEKIIVVCEIEAPLGEPEYIRLTQRITTAVSENHELEVYEIDLIEKGGIPKTGSGKVQRKACRMSHINQELSVLHRYYQEISRLASRIDKPVAIINPRILETLKKEVFLPLLKIDYDRIKAAETISELGLDSIQYVRIAKQIEAVYKIQFSPVLLFKYRSFGDLAQYIASQTENPLFSANNSAIIQEVSIRNLPVGSERDIAIIGVSCHFPGGAVNLDIFWENLFGQEDGITDIAVSRPGLITDDQKYYGNNSDAFPRWGGFIDDVAEFDASFFNISPLEAESMDPQQRKLLELTWSVIEDSGYNPTGLSGKALGLFIGVHNNDYAELVSRNPELTAIYGGHLDSGLHMSMITHRVSRWFNFHGPSEIVNTACSSSLVAICHAVESIHRGDSSLAIAGGINIILTSRVFHSSDNAGMLSKDGRCKTFDEAADGFVRAEGYGAVMLKPYGQAVKDGDMIYGVIKKAVLNHDGKSNSLRAPNLNAQKELIKAAYQDSGLSPETIGYIETHGTGTALGDPIEIQALQEAFNELKIDLPSAFCGLGTVKTNIGHCESAAGIAGLLKVLLALKHHTLPGILHFNKLNPYIQLEGSPFYIVEETQPWKRLTDASGKEIPLRAGISSFGFGGANAHVVIEEYISKNQNRTPIISLENPAIILLSAKDEERLKEQARRLLAVIRKQQYSDSDLSDIAYTFQVGREAMEERLGLIAGSIMELVEKLQGFLDGRDNISDCYHGQVKRTNETSIASLKIDEVLQEAVEKWFQHQKYGKIIELWVKGLVVDWDKLYGNFKPHRISLPTYPFAQESYWLPESDSILKLHQTSGQSFIHPLLHQNTSNLLEQRFSSIFTGWETFFADHVVNNQRTLAEAACLEMIQVAIKCATEGFVNDSFEIKLKNLVWYQPIIAQAKPFQVNIGLYPEESASLAGNRFSQGKHEIAYEIYTLPDKSDITMDDDKSEPVVYGRGEVVLTSIAAIPTLDITTILSQCSWNELSTGEIYEIFKTIGIDYGPSHQIIEKMYIGRELALIKLSYPLSTANNQGQFILHPGIDSVLQASMIIMMKSGEATTSLPITVQELEFFGEGSPVNWALIQYNQRNDAENNSPESKFDIDLCDEQGTIRVRLKSCSSRAWIEEKNPGQTLDLEPNQALTLSKQTDNPTVRTTPFIKGRRPEIKGFSLEQCMEWDLKGLINRILKIPREKIDREKNFAEYGFNSIVLTQFTIQLIKYYGIQDLNPTLFFKYTTVEKLARYILTEHQATIEDFYLEDVNEPTQSGPAITPKLPVMILPKRIAPERRGNRFGFRQRDASPSSFEPIAIIGMSGRFPGARNIDELWTILTSGQELVGEIPPERFDWRQYYGDPSKEPGKTNCKWCGSIDDVSEFDPLFFEISPREAETMDPRQRLLLQESWKALEDAGYGPNQIKNRKIGMFVGVEMGYQQAMDKCDISSNNNAILAARLAYFMNFNGPVMAIDTACSSGLVAVHQGVLSLRNGECDTAIAAGVTLLLTPMIFIEMGQAGMLSGDGKCFAFDKRANGTVPGEAVAVIVLKRLSQAEADGDPIYAVIKGNGINFDGKTNGITAPSGTSQTALLKTVYDQYRVNPEDIEYIVAHGTGTQLGDPIEINALDDAFKNYTRKQRYCALTSPKPNIGHSLGTSGLVSLISLVQAIRHQMIPASLHCEQENDHVNWQESPFYINKTNKSWPAKGKTLTGAVSAFGMSGTNAHVVVASYSGEDDPAQAGMFPKAVPYYLLAFSAKSQESLAEKIRDMIAVLEDKDISLLGLARISYTLLEGRHHFNYRCSMVVQDREHAVYVLKQVLNTEKTPNVFQAKVPRDFTGQKAIEQYAQDLLKQSRSLRENHTKYQETLFALAEFYCQGYQLNWQLLFDQTESSRIHLPTYPFAREHYWAPETDSKRNESASTGIITYIHPLLHQNTSNLSEQQFSSIFSSRDFFLADHIIRGEKVLPEAVCLEMARAAVEASECFPAEEQRAIKFKNIVWARPFGVNEEQVRINIGLYPEENGGIAYEIYSITEAGGEEEVYCQGTAIITAPSQIPVADLRRIQGDCNGRNFSGSEIYNVYQSIGLEYGPGYRSIERINTGQDKVLVKLSLPESVAETAERFILHPSIMVGALQAAMLIEIGDSDNIAIKPSLPIALEELEIYSRCTENMWALLQYSNGNKTGEKIRKFDIDFYDEHGQVCIRMKGFSTQIPEGEASETGLVKTTGSILFEPVWKESAVVEVRGEAQIPKYNKHLVILCELGEVTPESIGNRLKGVRAFSLQSKQKDIAKRYQTYAVQVFTEVQRLLEDKSSGKVLVQVVISNREEQQLFAGLSGLLKITQLENPKVTGQLIALETIPEREDLIAKLKENSYRPMDSVIRYQEGKRQVFGLNELKVNETADIPWKDGGVYLITGGAGGLGKIFAQEITNRVKDVTLLLSGRSSLDEQRQASLKELERGGAKVRYRSVDVADSKAVNELIGSIIEEFGKLDGIIHSAGIIKDNYIIKKNREEFSAVLSPKVTGLVNLDLASKDTSLDFMIFFSSAASILGNPGQADYATGNAFMDIYAKYRNELVSSGKRQGRTISINWTLWQEGGMRVDESVEKMMKQSTGMTAMRTQTGVRALYQTLSASKEQVMVVEGELPKIRERLLASSLGVQTQPEQTVASQVEPGILKEKTLFKIKTLFGEFIKISVARIDPDEPLESYGIDSVMITQLNLKLADIFGELSKTIFYEYQTIRALVEYLILEYSQECIRWAGLEIQAQTVPEVSPISTSFRNEFPKLISRRSGKRTTRSLQEFASNKEIREPIAIIGLSGRYPQAKNIEAYWDNLVAGRECITEIPEERWPLEGFYQPDPDEAMSMGKSYCKWGGFVDGFAEFDPLFFNISPKEALNMDPQERLFIQSCWEVLEDAGYTREQLAGQHHGRIGVFAGITKMGFELYGPDLWRQGESIFPHTSFSSVANRVSYFLNLQGPSMPVDTMCSSSLTAIHEACEYLHRGECELAIAGGVNLYLHPLTYIGLCGQQMLSRDGQCKSFGKDSNGFVPGEGVGTILLKPLSRAIADEDHIYAVIRATSINHGGKTNGYTVPNPIAQGELIRAALEKSGINARTVSYIEAHGTGTELGDPIEITGLTQAFRKDTEDSGYCAIGSVKSNIGHLEAAAGIAGVTKILLQMKHRKIVPSLHAEELNPNINFIKTPFTVQQELTEWELPVVTIDGETHEYPRLAGISSFGAGGSNAHIIIEEYIPEIRKQQPENTVTSLHPVLIVLSAKNEERLKEQAVQLLDVVRRRQFTNDDLADIAYTLQVGREAMEERLGFIVKSTEELVGKLAAFLAGKSGIEDLFYGQVKRNQETFAIFAIDDEMQEAIEKWIQRRKYGRLLDLWVKGMVFDWKKIYGDKKPQRISLPTYPFARERYWMPEIEIKSNKIMGTASAVIHPLLQQNTSDLSEQRYSSVFSGREFFLKDHLVMGQKILPGVAYLEMARAAVMEAAGTNEEEPAMIRLKNVVWARPVSVNEDPLQVHIGLYPKNNDEIAFEIYTILETGEPEELIYSQGSAVLSKTPDLPVLDLRAYRAECSERSLSAAEVYGFYKTIGLEYGPGHRGIEQIYTGEGRVLAKICLPESVTDTAGQFVLHPSIMDAALQAAVGMEVGDTANITSKPYLPFALEELEIYHRCTGSMWALLRYGKGSTAGDKVRKLDIDLCDEQGKVCVCLRGFSARVLEGGIGETGLTTTGRMMLEPIWRESAVDNIAGEAKEPDHTQHLVILCEPEVIKPEFIESRLKGVRVFTLQSRQKDIAKRFQNYTDQVFKEIQKILEVKPADPTLIQLVVSGDGDHQIFTGISGLLNTAQLENPKLRGQLIEVATMTDPVELIAKLKENSFRPMESHIRYHEGKRQIAGWNEVIVPAEMAGIPWKDGGVYLITGGAGGLGMIFTKEIVNRVKDAVLVLTGRALLDEQRQASLKELEQNGARIIYRPVDVTDRKVVNELIGSIGMEFGKLDGIIHSAGIIRDNYIIKKSPEELQEVLSPKVTGLVNLDQASQDLKLDFMILFSSIAGSIGNPGQADYSAANSFMDAYAKYRNNLADRGQRQGWTLAINWPLWQEGGMRVDETIEKIMKQSTGMVAMPTSTGIQALYDGIASGRAQVMVLEGDIRQIQTAFLKQPAVSGGFNLASNQEKQDSAAVIAQDLLQEKASNYFKKLLSPVIKLSSERIEADTPLDRYGIDSIMVMQLTNQLEKTFGSLSKTLFFEYQTIRELSGYFLENYHEKLNKLMVIETKDIMPTDTYPPLEINPVISLVRSYKKSRFAGLQSINQDSKPNGPLDIAIIGISGRYPQARNLEEFWENLRNGKDCITEIPKERWDHSRYYDEDKNTPGKSYSKWGGFLEGVDRFDPLFFNISPREAEIMDPQERLFLECVYETIEDAGYTRETLNSYQGLGLEGNVGVYVGVMYEEYQLYGVQEQVQGWPIALPGNPSSIANRVSHFFNFHGPSVAIDTMCSSSLTAIHLACQSIRHGGCELAIAGGVNVSIHPNKYLLLAQGKFASSKGRCESFGLGGDGYVPGEGVGALLMKPLLKAIADDDHIYGVIKGTAINHGGKTNGYTVPNPNAQAGVIEQALREAGVDPRTISYIEAHGTGTSLGDPIEMTGLVKSFRKYTENKQFCAIGSAKSNIGHCESAAGVAGVTKVLLQMKHRQIAPSLHSEVLNPNIDFSNTPFAVQQELAEWERPVVTVDGETREYPRISGISSFGAGGSNAHVVIEEYFSGVQGQSTLIKVTSRNPAIIVLSAKNEERLKEQALQLLTAIQTRQFEDDNLADLAYTLQVGREAMEERLAVIISSIEQLNRKLTAFLAEEDGIEDLYRAQVKRNQDDLTVFTVDEDMQKAIESWIKKGKYGKLLNLWVKGLVFDFNRLYGENKPRRISLPTYPFARERYWVPKIDFKLRKERAFIAEPIRPPKTEKTVLIKDWRPKELKISLEMLIGTIVVLGTAKTTKLALTLFHDMETIQVLPVNHGESDKTHGIITDFYSEPAGEALYRKVKEELNGAKITGVIDLTAYDEEYEQSTALEAGKLIFLQKMVANERQQGYCLMQVTYRLNSLEITKTTMQGARLAGLYRMLGAEYQQIKTLTMDIDCPLNFYKKAAKLIQTEFLSRETANYSECCYRNEIRYEPILKTTRNEKEIQAESRIPARYQPEEVVLITGGSRGIGATVAGHIVSQGVKNLIILGREELPIQSEWESVIAKQENPELTEKLKRMQAYIKRGVKVRYDNTSLNDETGIRAMLEKTRRELGPITGVFHCAGLVSKTPVFFEKPLPEIEAVCEPKVSGLVTLHRMLAEEPINFFILFSSISGIAPTLAVGQSDYAMANAYMDYYAMNQAGEGKNYLKSVQWPAWGETGMAAGGISTLAYINSGLVSHSSADGLKLLDLIKQSAYTVSVPCVILPDKFIPNQLLLTKLPVIKKEPGFKRTPALKTTGITQEIRLIIREWLQDIFIAKLKLSIDQLDSEKPFDEYGVDSIILAQLVTAMQERITKQLDPSLLLQYHTLDELTQYFALHHGEAFGVLGDFQHEAATQLYLETENDITFDQFESVRMKAKLDYSEVAVIGVACRFPGSLDKEAYWDLLTRGMTAIKPAPEKRWDTGGNRRDYGGWIDEIDLFDAKFFNINEKDAAAMDPQARIILEESLKAIYDAGYDHKQLSGHKVGVYIGGRSQPNPDISTILQAPNPILGVGQNYMATNISRFFNFTGPSMVVDTACSSGLTGTSLAAEALQGRRIEMALAGAVNLLLNPNTFELFEARNILSKNGEFHIFEEQSGGEVLGEGAGVVILKRLDDAIRDGNRIYGVIKAIAVNNDGRTIGPGSPNINTQQQVIEEALALSGKSIEEIGYIEVNGGGSPMVDAVEIKSLAAAYNLDNRDLGSCYVGSIKPNIGHLLLTSGMAELIRCILSVYHKQIPPFLSAREPFPYYDFGNSRIRFNREMIEWEVPTGRKRAAALNSFPDGGTNCHLIIEEFVPDAQPYQPFLMPKQLPAMTGNSLPKEKLQEPEEEKLEIFITKWGEHREI